MDLAHTSVAPKWYFRFYLLYFHIFIPFWLNATLVESISLKRGFTVLQTKATNYHFKAILYVIHGKTYNKIKLFDNPPNNCRKPMISPRLLQALVCKDNLVKGGTTIVRFLMNHYCLIVLLSRFQMLLPFVNSMMH